MNDDLNLSATPLTALSNRTRILLSSLLNPQKVIPSEGADKLPRDWQGLAALVNIPSETLSDNGLCQDKMGKVLELWQQRRDSTATLGQLLLYLQKIDRYDICDDLEELYKQGLLLEQTIVQTAPQSMISTLREEANDLITTHDVTYNTPQLYHAFVLFAKEDKEFVDQLIHKMERQGFKICTADDLLAGSHSQYRTISTLVSERCNKIIIIYSPDFFRSPANNFFIDYVQADGIESNKINLIPCMYRNCELPRNHRFYHKLYYTPSGQTASYDFWDRLSQSLRSSNPSQPSRTQPRPINLPVNDSAIGMTESQSNTVGNSNSLVENNIHNNFLLPPIAPGKSRSANNLNVHPPVSDHRRSLSNHSDSLVSEDKSIKKVSKIKKIINTLSGKKYKNKVSYLAEGC